MVSTDVEVNRVAAANAGCPNNVPEPASLPLVFVALAGMGLALRRQRRSGAGRAPFGGADLPESA